jgi:hypothetical protein
MDKGGWAMSSSERERFHDMQSLSKGLMLQREAAERLGLGVRQLKRLLRAWQGGPDSSHRSAPIEWTKSIVSSSSELSLAGAWPGTTITGLYVRRRHDAPRSNDSGVHERIRNESFHSRIL